jgi:hypothetical protein
VDTAHCKVYWNIKDGRHEPEVDMKQRISKLEDMISTKFKRLPHVFGVQQHRWTRVDTVRSSSMWEIKYDYNEPDVDMKKRLYQLADVTSLYD